MLPHLLPQGCRVSQVQCRRWRRSDRVLRKGSRSRAQPASDGVCGHLIVVQQRRSGCGFIEDGKTISSTRLTRIMGSRPGDLFVAGVLNDHPDLGLVIGVSDEQHVNALAAGLPGRATRSDAPPPWARRAGARAPGARRSRGACPAQRRSAAVPSSSFGAPRRHGHGRPRR